jgi:hypothetical protein
MKNGHGRRRAALREPSKLSIRSISGKNGRFLKDHNAIVGYRSCMRTLGTILFVAGILFSVIAVLKANPATTARRQSHGDAANHELRIAKPEGMKAIPRELIPLP